MVEFGLRVTARTATTSLLEAAVCRFCECWGREADFTLMDYRRNSCSSNMTAFALEGVMYSTTLSNVWQNVSSSLRAIIINNQCFLDVCEAVLEESRRYVLVVLC
jgi:hypothetical protein